MLFSSGKIVCLIQSDYVIAWGRLLEAWLVLTSVKYHGNLYILIPLNQQLALTRLRATGPRTIFCKMATCEDLVCVYLRQEIHGRPRKQCLFFSEESFKIWPS